MGELRQGIERIKRRAAKKAAELNSWLHTTLEAYDDRILPIDRSVAEEWGRMNVPDPLPAIAMVYSLQQPKSMVCLS